MHVMSCHSLKTHTDKNAWKRVIFLTGSTRQVSSISKQHTHFSTLTKFGSCPHFLILSLIKSYYTNIKTKHVHSKVSKQTKT